MLYNLRSFALLCLIVLLTSMQSPVQAQYARGNSPYSKYGLGDLFSGMLPVNQSMAGAMAATYRDYWGVNLVNPASLGKLRFTAFQLGLNYEHHELSERSTGLTAQADNGNLTSISLAFPITKSWEVMRDTLRRGVPIQWGMGFSLMPFSNLNYDVTVLRDLENIPNVQFNYSGTGSRYRVNFSNGFTYKGLSVGVNTGLLFGKVINTAFIDFQDSAYINAFDESTIEDLSGVGFIWDAGVQYEITLKERTNKANLDENLQLKRKLTLGLYAGGVSRIRTESNVQYIRAGTYYSPDSVFVVSGIEGTMDIPLKLGAGFSFGSEATWLLGVNYETRLWDMYRVNDQADPYVQTSHKVAVGMQWIPNFIDFSNYFNRVKYRVGLSYASDYRTLQAADGSPYPLTDVSLSFGAGFPLRPPKSKAIEGHLNVGFDVGYFGNNDLINDIYFRVNLGFAMNASGWFTKSKFR